MKGYLIGLFLFSSSLVAGEVFVIGTDSEGKELVYPAKLKTLEKALTLARSQHFSAANDLLSKNRDLSQWELKEFTLGLGVEGEAGIGPWNLGLAIKQRLVFKRN
jgi:hypothetical protein